MEVRIEWKPARATGAREAETRWSLVLAAAGPRAGSALAELSARYWGAAYAYIRRCGPPPALAHELTAAFFALLAEEALRGMRGLRAQRFRDVLLSRLAQAHADRWRELRRTPAPRELRPPWPPEACEDRYLAEVGDHDPPEQAFARGWSHALVTRCFERMRADAEARGRLDTYERLLPFLRGEPHADEVQRAALATGLTPAGVAFTLANLRRRLRAILAEEAADTMTDGAAEGGPV